MSSYTGKNKPQHFDTVLFDMDGVVVDSMHAHAECWIKVFSNRGIHVDKTDIFTREGMTGLDSIADIFMDKGCAVPVRDELLRLQNEKLSLFSQYSIHVYPQMFTLLPLLKEQRKAIGIVTGSFRYLVSQLIPADLLRLVDVVISVDDVKNGKPHPDPYIEALKKLGASASTAVVVENAPMGIKSAKAAGLYCVAITTTLDPGYLCQADAVVHDHDELLGFLQM